MSAPELHEALRHLGANVRRQRVRRGLTQADLAESVDRDLRFVQRIERGVGTPSLATVVGLAQALDVPLAALFKPARLTAPRTGRPPAGRRK